MRYFLLLMAGLLSGCKTAEIAFIYPATGIQLVARLQAKEESSAEREAPQVAFVPASSMAAVERVSYTQELLKPPVRDPYVYPELERTPAVRSQ